MLDNRKSARVFANLCNARRADSLTTWSGRCFSLFLPFFFWGLPRRSKPNQPCHPPAWPSNRSSRISSGAVKIPVLRLVER